MPGLVPGIRVFCAVASNKTWMTGSSPAMTALAGFDGQAK
jgi:hypothetical protein